MESDCVETSSTDGPSCKESSTSIVQAYRHTYPALDTDLPKFVARLVDAWRPVDSVRCVKLAWNSWQQDEAIQGEVGLAAGSVGKYKGDSEGEESSQLLIKFSISGNSGVTVV
jgi:hypothetical protein